MAPKPEPVMLVADRGTFEAKAEELETRLQALQARLMDDTLSADELANLPIEIGDTRQALKVIRARIAAFEISDCDKTIAEYEAQIAQQRPILNAQLPAMQKMRDWELLHLQTIQTYENNQAAVERCIAFYGDVMRAHAIGFAAQWQIEWLTRQIAELKRRKDEAVKRRAAVTFRD